MAVGVREMSAAEAAMVRKIDWRILPFVSWLYLLSFLDRSNISNVKQDLEDALGLGATQYSKAVGIFYLGYILFEIPSNLVLKKMPPRLWIGIIVIAWGICSVCMVTVSEYWHLLLVRLFLGISEAGFFPGIVFYLTFWYKRSEQGLRIALFYCSSALAGAFGGLLAYGILQMDSVEPYEPWQWLFLLEGIPSILFGVVTWFALPDYPESAQWLTPQERQLATARLAHLHKTDSVGKIDMPALWATLMSAKVWGFALLLYCIVAPTYAISFYLPTLIQSFGFDKLQSNLLTSPIYFVAFFVIIANALHSDRTGERPWHLILSMTTGLVGFSLVIVGTYLQSTGLSYFAMFLATTGAQSGIPLLLAWLTNSIRGTTRAATATGLVVGVSNLGGIVGPNLYGALEYTDENGVDQYTMAHLCMVLTFAVGILIALLLVWRAKDDPVEETEPLLVNSDDESEHAKKRAH